MTEISLTPAVQPTRKFVAEIPHHAGPTVFVTANPFAPDTDLMVSILGPNGGWVSGGFMPGPDQLTFSFDAEGGRTG